MKTKAEKVQDKLQTPSPVKARSRRRLKVHPVLIKRGAIFSFGLATLLGAVWGMGTTRNHLSMTQAETQLGKGFAALASETLEPVRFNLTSTPRGCKVLMDAYYGSRRADRLEWASQSCLEAGIEQADVYLGLAASRELTGRDSEALQLLGITAPRFDQTPDIYYRMGQILKRNKKDQEAATAMIKAAERAPQNHQLTLETLELLSSVRRWKEAKQMADRIKSLGTDNPEIKLIIARALLNAGDQEGAAAVKMQARQLLSANPENKITLELNYSDVLGPPAPPSMVAAPTVSETSRRPASTATGGVRKF